MVLAAPSTPTPPSTPAPSTSAPSAPPAQKTNKSKNKKGGFNPNFPFGGNRPWMNPWTGTFHMAPLQPGQGILGPRPSTAPPQPSFFAGPPTLPPPPRMPFYGGLPGLPFDAPSWDQASLINALNAMTVHQPSSQWYADSGASSHLAPNSGNLSTFRPSSSPVPRVIVGDGSPLPIISSGTLSLPSLTCPLHLSNVLVSPKVIANLLSVRKFTTNNSCSTEFDPFGLSVRDLHTRVVIHRCNSSGDLYPFLPASTTPLVAAAMIISEDTWPRWLGHPGSQALACLQSSHVISLEKNKTPSPLCHACQLG